MGSLVISHTDRHGLSTVVLSVFALKKDFKLEKPRKFLRTRNTTLSWTKTIDNVIAKAREYNSVVIEDAKEVVNCFTSKTMKKHLQTMKSSFQIQKTA